MGHEMPKSIKQPWIHSARVDGAFILAPGLMATAIALWLMLKGFSDASVTPYVWLVLIVGIDVAHVYSTLYRTYLDRKTRGSLSTWLWLTPLLAWLGGVMVYTLNAAWFWTALAYIAVFHFVRQQYGFVMIYARNERTLPAWCKRLDQLSIYTATVGPLVYWHTHLPANFVWFVEGDFVALPLVCWTVGKWLYMAILVSYAFKEVWLQIQRHAFNWPRNAMMLITTLSWYVGIVIAHGDLIFTLTNVVAHGVPYIALTFMYKQAETVRYQKSRTWFAWPWLPAAFGLLVLIAYVEEGLWDGLVWRDHVQLFSVFSWLPHVETATLLAIVVPLLTVPQLTHYILDAVIWRLRDRPEWRQTLFWFSDKAYE
jgi:hypothetical protein